MKQEDTKNVILQKSLDLFSERGYDAVSVGEIAKAVGIKAPSLYNHYPSKQAIFDAIVEKTAAHYADDTDKNDIHVENAQKDVPSMSGVSIEDLQKKVRFIFEYSLHDETVAKFRKMMKIEQFRTSEFAKLYSQRYVDRLVEYHARIFENLIARGEILPVDPTVLATMYATPIITLIDVCDRQPDREEECLKRVEDHVKLFFDTFNVARGNKNGEND